MKKNQQLEPNYFCFLLSKFQLLLSAFCFPNFSFSSSDIPSCQRLTKETGGGGTTNGVLAQCPFVDEALEDSTDFLHDFLMDSS
jgi:hypothetical protein